MYTKKDFVAAITANIDKHPAAAVLWRAGDPRLIEIMLSIAEMASMLSQQQEMVAMEAFEKARDTTVLADAALKGIVPQASPAQIIAVWTNNSDSAYQVVAGKRLLDTNGRIYEVLQPAIAPPNGGTADVTLIQYSTNIISHTVSGSEPFYSILIPEPTNGRYIAGISVLNADNTTFQYRYRFTNVSPDELVYHIETDEYRRIYIKFGYEGYAGYQPEDGEILKIVVHESDGDVRPTSGSLFTLEYLYNSQDARQDVRMKELLQAGSNPFTVPVLRELSRYPSIYDDNAVYLGEFDSLLRRNLSGLEFLSVWNEEIERKVRGENVDHINRLFVAYRGVDADDVWSQDQASASATQENISRIIGYADDSYRITFVEPVISNIYFTIHASIARVHNIDAVKGQIRDALLLKYGIGTAYARRGNDAPRQREAVELIRSNVVALQDAGSDFRVTIVAEQPPLPEHWHYVTQESIVINIEYANYAVNQWGR